MSRLDWSCYPHIFDTVLAFVLDHARAQGRIIHGPNPTPDDVLLRTLRLTNRLVRNAIDQYIKAHAVVLLKPHIAFTYVGKLQLFVDTASTAQVRILDVHPGTADKILPPPNIRLEFQFSKVWYARVFSESCEKVLDRLVGENTPDLTVIYPVLCFENRERRVIGNMKIHATRIITVLPLHTYPHEVQHEWHLPMSASTEQVFAIVSPASRASNTLNDHHPSEFKKSCVGLHIDIMVSTIADGRESFTLVGMLQAWKTAVTDRPDGAEVLKGLSQVDDGLFESPKGSSASRRISWAEWRSELSSEEWDLLQSLPGVCWETYRLRDTA